jgi:hypothetical protein
MEPVVIKSQEKRVASRDTNYLRTNVIVDNTVGSIVCVLKLGDIESKLNGIDALKGHGGVVIWVTEEM